MILDILPDSHPFLRNICVEISEVTQELHDLSWNMIETMFLSAGVGLAANQVGEKARLLVMLDRADLMIMFNPEILSHSEDMISSEEGCLSFPGKFVEVKRWAEVEVKFLDEAGVETTKKLKGLGSIIFQHELDHLNGILMTDHVGL